MTAFSQVARQIGGPNICVYDKQFKEPNPAVASGALSVKCACRDQRNASATAAAIKPSVASQLTVPINSSVMRQCSPAVSDGLIRAQTLARTFIAGLARATVLF